MSIYSKVLYALDCSTEPRTFERLCVDLLRREGYHEIIPGGGVRDHGRDAEIRSWEGHNEAKIRVAFQFSMEKAWEKKIRRDTPTIMQHCKTAKILVFVTSQGVSGEKKDKLHAEFKQLYGLELCFFDREWLRHRLEEVHQDLAKKYLEIDNLPETVCHAEVLIDLHGLDNESEKEIFKNTTPENIKATIAARILKHPDDWMAWKRLALVEYHLHNYTAAMQAVSSALRIAPHDINLKLLNAAILAENGIRTRSHALLLQAQEVYDWMVQKRGKAIDHYNLANVLGALEERDTAEKHYRQCLKKQPDYPQAWKNLGSLLFYKGDHTAELECYEKALALKPNLVEAIISKGVTLLRVFRNPHEALQCFELAYKIDTKIDNKWGYARYWYGATLFSLERHHDALIQVELGLSLVPDDKYLLAQKAALLAHLWRSDSAYETHALKFFKFRVLAGKDDYAAMDELIQLLTKHGVSDTAWPLIDSCFHCSPFSMRDIAEKVGISITQLRIGFSFAASYKTFRNKYSIEDHFTTMHDYGLAPNPIMENALSLILMAPFGVFCQEIRETTKADKTDKLVTVFNTALSMIAEIFAAMGAHWLSSKPSMTQKRRLELLSLGVKYLPDVIVAETSRQFGYCIGHFGIAQSIIPDMKNRDWSELYSVMRTRFLDRAAKDWDL